MVGECKMYFLKSTLAENHSSITQIHINIFFFNRKIITNGKVWNVEYVILRELFKYLMLYRRSPLFFKMTGIAELLKTYFLKTFIVIQILVQLKKYKCEKRHWALLKKFTNCNCPIHTNFFSDKQANFITSGNFNPSKSTHRCYNQNCKLLNQYLATFQGPGF